MALEATPVDPALSGPYDGGAEVTKFIEYRTFPKIPSCGRNHGYRPNCEKCRKGCRERRFSGHRGYQQDCIECNRGCGSHFEYQPDCPSCNSGAKTPPRTKGQRVAKKLKGKHPTLF